MGVDALYWTLTFALYFSFGSGQRAPSSGDTGESIVVHVENSIIFSTLPFADLPSMSKCGEDFIIEMNDWSGNSKKGKLGQRSGSRSAGKGKVVISAILKVPDFAICCALSKLRDCILDDVRTISGEFGDKVTSLTNQMVLNSVDFFKNTLTNSSSNSSDHLDCDLDAWYYEAKNSPLCWSTRGQFIGVFFFSLLLTVLIICCCVLAQGKHQGQGQTSKGKVFVPLTSTSNESFGFWKLQNPFYRQFHNSKV